jgi:protein transport protein DSL1/ZW10
MSARSSQGDSLLGSRISSLSTIIEFLARNFFVHIPLPNRTPFLQSLSGTVANSVLKNLLIPQLPSSFHLLPPFLHVVRDAVIFEDTCIVSELGTSSYDKIIRNWADNVGSHYERQRRVDLLDMARRMLLDQENQASTFEAEAEVVRPQQAIPQEELQEDLDSDPADPETSTDGSDNGWGFDSDLDMEKGKRPLPGATVQQEPDPDDAWGLTEDEDILSAEDDSAWDDPWGEPGAGTTMEDTSSTLADVSAPIKVAKRLERAANKNKRHQDNSHPTSPASASSTSPYISSNSGKEADSSTNKMPIKSIVAQPTEFYRVSGIVKKMLSFVGDVLREGEELSSSGIISAQSGKNAPGRILLYAAPAILDMYRALWPSNIGQSLESSPSKSIQFSNDCLYLGQQIQELAAKHPDTTSLFAECSLRFLTLSDRLLYTVTVRTKACEVSPIMTCSLRHRKWKPWNKPLLMGQLDSQGQPIKNVTMSVKQQSPKPFIK